MKTGKGDIQVRVKEGQFIYGRDSAARELRMEPSSVRNRIVKLSKLQNLNIKSDRQFSIVTINNWGIYKELMFKDRTGKRTTKGQAKDTDNNVNNVNNVINNDHFEKIWSRYPNKVSKQTAQEKFLESVETEEDFTHINKALENYRRHLECNPWKNVKNGEKWFNDNEWRSWVDFEEPQAQPKGKGWL